jgi:hypothetical protein
MSFWELTTKLQTDPKVRKQFGNKPDPLLVDTDRNVSGGG